MIFISKRCAVAKQIDDQLALPFELRQKSRLRVTLQSGQEAGLFLTRGQVLRDGDLLEAEDGTIVQVVAALEKVMDVMAQTPRDLTCAAYHLGNRHVPLQVGDGWLRLEQDNVLKDMLLGLGVSVFEKEAAFEPEAGAYDAHRQHGHSSLKPSNTGRKHG